MIFGHIGMARPEQFPKLFRVYSVGMTVTDTGRLRLGGRDAYVEARCILSIASPQEVERYHQMGVTVTHTIIQRGEPLAKEHDVFALVQNGVETRWFTVQSVHDKGEMGIDTTYICEERGDRA